jgi:hypothetical protein
MSELYLTKEAYLNSNEQRAVDDMVRTAIHEEETLLHFTDTLYATMRCCESPEDAIARLSESLLENRGFSDYMTKFSKQFAYYNY